MCNVVTSVFFILLHGVISLPDMTSYDFVNKAMFGIGIDSVISELFYKRANLQRNCRKMSMISWSFYYNSFVKFRGKKV